MSDYYRVPERDLDGITIPALFLGDNGFNAKFGSTLTDDQVRSRMAGVLQSSNLGLAAGDDRLLRLAREAEETAEQSAIVMSHIDLPVADAAGPLRYRSCGGTLRAELTDRGVPFESDPILSYLLRFSRDDGLSKGDLARLRIDVDALAGVLDSLDRHRPTVVTVGGDWLDMLVLSGQDGLVQDGLRTIGAALSARGIAVALTLYVGALVDFVVPEFVPALLVPLNPAGAAMLPNPIKAKQWADGTQRHLIAMHTMPGSSGPVDALRNCGVVSGSVTSAVVGASRTANIRALVSAANALWRSDA